MTSMSKKEILLVGGGFLVLLGVVYYFTQCTAQGCTKQQGLPAALSFRDCAAAGNPVLESSPRRCVMPNGVQVTETAGKQSNSAAPSSSITVLEPTANAFIGLPVSVRGTVSTFENLVSYQLLDVDGSVLAQGQESARSDGSFFFSVTYPRPFGTTGTLHVYESLPNGSTGATQSIPIKFMTVETADVRVSFMNVQTDPDREHCDQVSAYPRRVLEDGMTERAALEELLKGPTDHDRQQGAQTAIPDGVTLQNFVLIKGTATADFSDVLLTGLFNPCRAQAIRSQIRQTLLQFPTVKNVTVSVNGKKVLE